ncbi:MAG: hypothetical protein KA163_05930 [Bacteroidia bacterium]|nr:hypothetical protein [Bacteroidia bacterium]
MKKLFIPTLIILVATLYFGCAKKKTNVEFDIPYSYTIAVPSLTMDVPTTFTTPSFVTNIAEQLSKNGTNSDLVGEMKCTSFNIAVTSPTIGAGSNLSYIRWIKFYVNAINQPEIQSAFIYNDNIPVTATTTALNINDNNIKNRFVENSVYYTVKIDPKASNPASTITVTHNIHVKAITQ